MVDTSLHPRPPNARWVGSRVLNSGQLRASGWSASSRLMVGSTAWWRTGTRLDERLPHAV
jgi:hypothetical protein